MDQKQNRRRNADIGILTVIPVELEWTRKALEIREDSRQKNRTGRVYFAGEVGSKLAKLSRPDVGHVDFSVQQDITSYLSFFEKEERIAELFLEMGGLYPRSSEKFRAQYRKHVGTKPRIIDGSLASGNKLLKNPSVLHNLQAQGHGRIKAGEMEASGLVTACHQQKVPWLVIRGISDFGDRLKSDDFHAFAAQMAAAVLRDFIAEGLDLTIARPRRGPKITVAATTPSVTEILKVAAHIKKMESSTRVLTPGRQNILELARPLQLHGFRIVRKDYSPRLPSMRGGRWHASLPFLYFAKTASSAFLEWIVRNTSEMRVIPESRIDSSVIAEFDIHLSRVLDLTDYRTMLRLDLNSQQLVSDDFSYTQSVGDAAYAAGCEGLIVPSAVGPQSSYLVVFESIDRLSKLDMLTVSSLRESSDFLEFLSEIDACII